MATAKDPVVFPLTGATPFEGGAVFNPADFVRVTNRDANSTIGHGAKTKQAIIGRYNGKDYLFPFDTPINVSLDVARHLFGLGADDKSAALARLGWAKTSDELPDAIERLANIRFEDLPELMEASRFTPGRSPAITHASGLVKGDGTDGGALKGASPDDLKV